MLARSDAFGRVYVVYIYVERGKRPLHTRTKSKIFSSAGMRKITTKELELSRNSGKINIKHALER